VIIAVQTSLDLMEKSESCRKNFATLAAKIYTGHKKRVIALITIRTLW
jgi:hypothetical protein